MDLRYLWCVNSPIPETQVVTTLLNQGTLILFISQLTTDSNGHSGGIQQCKLVAEEP